MNISRTIHDHVTFRVILQGMSHPGKVYLLPDVLEAESTAAQLLGCLMDNEASLAVIGDAELEALLVRHTGSRPASFEHADFIVVRNGTTFGNLIHFKRGSLEYPHTGATILYLVEELSDAGNDIVVTGPGVKGTASLRITGIHPGEWYLLKEANSEFPLGVDAVFLDRSGRIACIPRSSQIGVN
jgi:alpha-D-ribose 1-methylphosphonate 5-triphosphate synthase subunit PhnH